MPHTNTNRQSEKERERDRAAVMGRGRAREERKSRRKPQCSCLALRGPIGLSLGLWHPPVSPSLPPESCRLLPWILAGGASLSWCSIDLLLPTSPIEISHPRIRPAKMCVGARVHFLSLQHNRCSQTE